MNTSAFLLILQLCILPTVSSLSQPNVKYNAKCNELQRRHFMDVFIPCSVASCALITKPESAMADLNSAAASGVPLLGRFEQLKGANSFIGQWKYEADKGIKQGKLIFLKNGEVELRSDNDASSVIAVGAVPWKYVSPKGTDTIVTVTFTLDEDGEDDVLIFQGTLDSAGGPNRMMIGSIATGRAEIGARGSGPMKRVGSFKAEFEQ